MVQCFKVGLQCCKVVLQCFKVGLQCCKVVLQSSVTVGWALFAVKIEFSMNRLAAFHKVGPGRGEHDGEKSFRIGSLICPAVRARSYA